MVVYRLLVYKYELFWFFLIVIGYVLLFNYVYKLFDGIVIKWDK